MTLEKELKMKRKINTVRHAALLDVVRTANFIDKEANVFFKAFGITQAQYNVLIVLKLEGKDLTQVGICERLVVSRANITSILDKLQKKGYIRRKSIVNDRRVYEIELTPAGKKLLTVVEPAYIEEVEKIMKSISEDACRKLSRTLVALRDTLKEQRRE